jgi:hypothetical protein
MYSNCLVVAIAFRATHKGSRIRATVRGKGENGLFPHFYAVLQDGTRVEFRASNPPLSKLNQVCFGGALRISK